MLWGFVCRDINAPAFVQRMEDLTRRPALLRSVHFAILRTYMHTLMRVERPADGGGGYSHAAVASGARGDRGRTTGAGNDGRAVSAEVPQRLWKRDRDFGRHGAFYCHQAARLRHTTRRFRRLAPVARTIYLVVSID